MTHCAPPKSSRIAVTRRQRQRTKRIGVSDIEAALREIAQADPEHTDRRADDGLPARYVDDGQPNCLVARVLTRLGFSIGVLRALDREFPVGELIHAGVSVGESRHPALRKIDPLAIRLLQYVQERQDRGEQWGRIVRDAFSVGRVFPQWDRRRKPWIQA